MCRRFIFCETANTAVHFSFADNTQTIEPYHLIMSTATKHIPQQTLNPLQEQKHPCTSDNSSNWNTTRPTTDDFIREFITELRRRLNEEFEKNGELFRQNIEPKFPLMYLGEPDEITNHFETTTIKEE